MSFFKDKVVVITGGSEGIGKALVNTFIDAGAKVATCARNFDKLYSLQLRHTSVELHTMACDLSNEQDCRRFIESTIKTFGGIDILINNAGMSMRAPFRDVDVDVIKRLMDINFYGAVHCTKFALESIIERRGSIVAISSIAGFRGLPGRTGYSASKFALQGWMEALRTEMLDTGVNVMWVCPGFTASNIRNAALNKDGNAQGESPLDEASLMTAEEVATRTLKAIEQRKRTLLLTFNDRRTIFLNRFFPRLTDKLVHKFFYKNGELIK